MFTEVKSSLSCQKQEFDTLKEKLECLKEQIGQQNSQEFCKFFENNMIEVWKELGYIKLTINNNIDQQSDFTNLNSLTNELKKNFKGKENNIEDLDFSD